MSTAASTVPVLTRKPALQTCTSLNDGFPPPPPPQPACITKSQAQTHRKPAWCRIEGTNFTMPPQAQKGLSNTTQTGSRKAGMAQDCKGTSNFLMPPKTQTSTQHRVISPTHACHVPPPPPPLAHPRVQKHLARLAATWEVQSVFSAEKRKEIQRHMLNSNPPSTSSTVIAVPPPLPVATPQPQPQPQPQSQPQSQPPLPAPIPATTVIYPPPTLAPVAAPVPAAAAPLPPPPPPPPPQPQPQPMATVAPTVAPAVVTPDIQAMINSRMKQLLDQQVGCLVFSDRYIIIDGYININR